MVSHPRFVSRLRDALLIVVGVGLMALLARELLDRRPPPVYTLGITAGKLSAERTRLLRALASEARTHGIVLNLIETLGSEDALARLAKPRSGLDLALVQGGLTLDHAEGQRLDQVATLHDEPLHLLVRGEVLARQVEAEGPGALRGRSVSISNQGSGCHRLALEVLRFAGLTDSSYTRVEIDAPTLISQPPDTLPDALFLIALLPSDSAATLISKHDYRLVPLPYGRAFALWHPPEADATGIIHRSIRSATIPAQTYDREPAIPGSDMETLATRCLLVARTDLDPALVERLLDVVYESPFARHDEPTLNKSALDESPELPWHEGSVRYKNRSRPFIAEDLVDQLEKRVSIGAGVLGGLFFLWQALQRRIRTLSTEGFESYMVRVLEIERAALALEAAPEMDLAMLLKLQRDLARLKTEALGRFTSGDLRGEELLAGFLAQVNDARESLTRLLLHQRSNLEEQAALQGVSPQTLWKQALAASTILDSSQQTPIG